MPTMTVYTTAPRQAFPDDFLPNTVKLISKVLNKPFKGIAVILCNEVDMHFGEVSDQMINVQVIGVGDFRDGVKNERFISVMVEYFTEITGIPAESIGISLKDVLPIQIGFAGGELARDRIRRRKVIEPEPEPKN